MFGDLRKKIAAVKRFDVKVETLNIINEYSDVLVNMLRKQLSEGKDGDGKRVTVFGSAKYHPQTIKYKTGNFGLSGVTSYITNYDTGDFYDTLYVITTGGSNFVIESTVPYFPEILLQSKEIIMHVSREHLREFVDAILVPELERRLKQSYR